MSEDTPEPESNRRTIKRFISKSLLILALTNVGSCMWTSSTIDRLHKTDSRWSQEYAVERFEESQSFPSNVLFYLGGRVAKSYLDKGFWYSNAHYKHLAPYPR